MTYSISNDKPDIVEVHIFYTTIFTVVLGLFCSGVGMFLGYALGKKRSSEEIQ